MQDDARDGREKDALLLARKREPGRALKIIHAAPVKQYLFTSERPPY
jgi:hypothetical protein